MLMFPCLNQQITPFRISRTCLNSSVNHHADQFRPAEEGMQYMQGPKGSRPKILAYREDDGACALLMFSRYAAQESGQFASDALD